MQEAPIHQSHVYGRIKILQTIFEKGHQRNIPVKLFQNLIIRFSSCPYIVQEAPIHQSNVFGQIKISQTLFEKGHPRNIPAKLFQNLTSGFEEDFLRISSCPYSARSPRSPQPCLWTDQNFANKFWKGSPKEHSCEIISKSDQRFRRISSCPYSARSPHSPEPCLWTDQNFANNFWKGSPKEHSCEIILKSDHRFLRRRFLKNYLQNSVSLPWQPEFLMESNSVNNFWRGPPKEHSCQVWSKLAQRFGRRRCLKKLLMMHDGRWTPHHPKSSPWACCAQVS